MLQRTELTNAPIYIDIKSYLGTIDGEMSSFKTINIFLAAYLVLFLNFGPSYHSAFVGHDGCCASSVDSVEHQGCACACESPRNNEDSQPDSYVSQQHDCPFCNFFDQLHLTMEFQTVEVLVCQQALDFVPIELKRQSLSIESQARGPPASFFTA